MKVFNEASGQIIGEVQKADTFWTRLFGMLFTDPQKDARGLWLEPCAAVHLLGMRRPLDIIFLDSDLKVLKVVSHLAPWTPFAVCGKARSVLEFFSGKSNAVQVHQGDRLSIR